MQSNFFKRFRRITYSTSYLPEIDGLRFLAIFSVVAILHTTHYIDLKFYGGQLLPNAYWKNFVLEGGYGVSLFFVISGFILSLPFAKWRLNKKEKISIRNYYLRRLTRLEPPYIIALVILFIGNVWVLHSYSFSGLLPNFLVSLVYLNSFIYHTHSLVMPIAWSLEMEVQFYILAPLFCLIFLIPLKILRRSLLVAAILAGSIYWFDIWRLGTLFTYLHFFLCGLLLADFYCSGLLLFRNKDLGFIVGVCSLIGFIFIPSIHFLYGYLLKLLCIFMLIHTTLTNAYMKKLFSVSFMVIIGGMCYSIYLLHFAIISFMGMLLLRSGIDLRNLSNLAPIFLLFITTILIISSIYFLLIEKPFMRPASWIRRKR